MFTDDTERVTVRDPRVEMDLPDDDEAEWLSVLRPVYVRVPGYRCACGARWYALDGDTIEDSRAHYERHTRLYCDAADTDEDH